MERFQFLLKKNYATMLVFIGIFIVILWQIGSCPNSLDDYVEYEVHPQVSKVFDHLMTPGEITWDWTEMYQGEGGRSPIYGALIELGLRLFGLTLFGIRIFPALIGFLVLLFTYYTMAKFYPKTLSLLFIALLGTTPWYLAMIRSGGLSGFSLSLALLAISAVALLLKKDYKGILVPILAGVSVALLPYGYMILRPLYLILISIVLFSFRRIKFRNLLLFLVCFLALSSFQFNNLQGAKDVFFNSRGESMYTAIGSVGGQKADLYFLTDKIIQNTIRHFNFLLGFNQWDRFWNPNLAYAYWRSDIVLYPRFLAPFFIAGLLYCLVGFRRKPSLYYLTPLLFFGLGLIPGTMSLVGEPNMSRCSLLVVPLYFFIALSFYQIGLFIDKKQIFQNLFRSEITVTQACMRAMSLALIAGILVFQVWNFFGYRNQRGERDAAAAGAYSFIADYFRKNPRGKVIYHERPVFGEYGAYVGLRVLGGKPFAEKVAAGNLFFVRNENLAEMSFLVYNQSVDLVVAAGPEILFQNLPIMRNYFPEKRGDLFIYYITERSKTNKVPGILKLTPASNLQVN